MSEPTPTFAETLRVGGLEFRFESGAVARQAGGSVLVTAGDTTLLAVATADKAARDLPFVPLTTEYRLRYSAAGRIPGSYERREAKPTEDETLTSRLIDRSVRPFFPDGWRYETQVIVQPLSYDPGSDPSVLGIAAASAALMASDIAWGGPVAGVRVGRVDGELKLFPSVDERARGDLDLIVTAGHDGIVMVEGGAAEVPEPVVQQAFALAREAAGPLLALMDRLRERGRPRREPPPDDGDAALGERVRALAEAPLREALALEVKEERYRTLDGVAPRVIEQLAAEGEVDEAAVGDLIGSLKKKLIRHDVLDGRRIGGRAADAVRAISGRTSWLKRCHGSSLFTRGETQAIVTCTLGTERDAKTVETLEGRQSERFLLHYSFPPYSVGEVRPLRGPGRREIGHGNLARRALTPVLPPPEELPYTVRIESLITESNGSSSMATVCGGTLALQDAGVAIKRPVAGIAMGLVKEGERFVVLSDILGDEDHVGDMDFKVCGTTEGITAIQLDNKIGALPDEVMSAALDQARAGRLHILERMAAIIPESRTEMSPHAPRAITLQIEPNRIGGLVGTGGKTIKGLQSELDIRIDVSQDGVVRVYGQGSETMRKAERRVIELAGVPRLGETYEGRVVGVKPFGSFVRIFEGIEGLLPDRELTMDASVKVRVTGVNNRGKLVLETGG